MNWYIEVLRKYAVFSGRARRREYWMFYLFNFIFVIIASVLDELIAPGSETGVITSIYTVAVLTPGIAAGVRRMHDVDRSGWWLLVPIVNLIFALTEGTVGDNRFGSDPKTDYLSF